MTKPRVQLDAFVIGAFMITTGICVLRFPGLFFEGPGVRDVFDVLGFFLILVGALLRMAGRGFKKYASDQGGRLVTGGPYKFVRNPMYLGTFLIAVGFMFPLFPVWTVPVFAFIFYSRFVIQIRLEEEWLRRHFGGQYTDYCRRVPAFIPTKQSFRLTRVQDIFPWQHLWTTKEKYGLFYWPLLSVAFELVEENFLWGTMNVLPVMINAVVAVVLLSIIAGARK
jgi:protein-S-isoprenylcysteine O-methyltransferase Ste14